VVVRDGNNLKGHLLGAAFGLVGRRALGGALEHALGGSAGLHSAPSGSGVSVYPTIVNVMVWDSPPVGAAVSW
jgi:hypothetical protein